MQIKFLLSSIYSFLFFMSFVSFNTNNNNNNNGNGRSGNGVLAQEPVFELPVQLVGFPVIVLAVRFTNFVKKLGYSLNPQTYKPSSSASSALSASSSSSSSSATRTRRSTAFINDDNLYIREISREAIDVSIAEKRILTELGPKACVMEEPCKLHASRHSQIGEQPDWQDILRNYKVHSSGMKQWYLLSVFLGDVIRDISLCKQLAKRLQCGRDEKPLIRD